MADLDFLYDFAGLPNSADGDRATRGLAQWAAAAEKSKNPGIAEFATSFAESPHGRALLLSLSGNSPFLSQCLLHEIGLIRDLDLYGLERTFNALLEGLDADARTETDSARLASLLRIAKRRAALLIAISDIAGAWDLDRLTRALSSFADAALQAALDYLLRQGGQSGDLAIADPQRPASNSGIFVLAVGKLGACELNYSSDIDLMVLFDQDRLPYTGRKTPQEYVVRLVRQLVPLLSERTGDGYVFRTDLRLRPDPRSTPLALSVRAAESYYESTGQNWERAALIKARPAAGDQVAGAEFLTHLKPFIWRKHLDFAAIQDIHSIKRQIDGQRTVGDGSLFGHNIKLGPGGIREIEFFAQTQQLIWGGREPEVREIRTCDALRALTQAGHVDAAACDQLIEAYGFLRRVEHRLQMIEDQQTQTLPDTEAGMESLAVFLGYDDNDAFRAVLSDHLGAVSTHYAQLFDDAPSLATPGNLVFTGADDDPETLATLAKMGFQDGAAISVIVRGWHHGRYRATRSARSRELLTALMPALLTAFGKTFSPDAALFRFDQFVAALPAGVQIFSLFNSNPQLLDLLAEIMGSAPRLAEILARRPSLLDGVLDADFFQTVGDARALEAHLAALLDQATDFQDILALSRRWVDDQYFQVGVQLLHGTIDAVGAGIPLSAIADAAVRTLKKAVESEFAAAHGHVPGGGMAVVGLGSHGAQEMSVDSDLDLLFIYDNPDNANSSDGPRPLPTSQYFARLGQRLISALTVQTGEGTPFKVDMRLRPSGNSGPLASNFQAFVKYHKQSAWTWEHMALTRARIIAAPDFMEPRIATAIREVIAGERDGNRLAGDVVDMRDRIAREHKPRSPWDVKYRVGGLIDVEFIAQYLVLRHAHTHPEIIAGGSIATFEALMRASVLSREDGAALIAAARLWRALRNVLRLTHAIGYDKSSDLDDGVQENLRTALVRASGGTDFSELKSRLGTTAAEIDNLFTRLIREARG